MPDFNKYSFFETPYSVASTLAKEITDHLPNRSSSFTVIDACAGSGRLSLQLVKHLPQYCIDVTLFDIQQDLLEVAKKQFTSEGFRVKTICIDLLRADVRHYCCHADIILCNPPFKGYRQCTLNERVLLRQFGLPPYNDIACAFVLRLLSYAPKNTILGILLRRDILWSKGYETFRHLVDSYANVLATVDLGRALLSNSGKAKSCALVLQRRDNCITGSSCNQQTIKVANSWTTLTALSLTLAGFAKVERGKGWIELSELADVIAGPNTGNDSYFFDVHDSQYKVVRLPPSQRAEQLWAEERAVSIIWKPEQFTQRRNLQYQGQPGIVYRLASSKFVTGILPAGLHFLSATPAIIPKDKKYLNLIIGCALTPAWRTAVRASIKSTNFTPSSVSRMLIPEYRTEVANSLEELGELAYKIVESYLFKKSIVPTSFEMEKFNLRLAAVNTELAALLGFDNQCASLYWGFSKPKSASSTDILG